MNNNDYCSLKMCEELLLNNIEFETKLVYNIFEDGSSKIGERSMVTGYRKIVPAPTMSELWQELPNKLVSDGITFCKIITTDKNNEETTTGYINFEDYIWEGLCLDKNPCDALAQLLIWFKENEKYYEKR